MKTVLIVEDDPTLNKILKTKLEGAGFGVLSAPSGEEGLSLLENGSVDLVLADIVMPKMDGIEMVYRWFQKKGENIPTIIMTNLEETAYPEYISKVFKKSDSHIVEVVQYIEEVLGTKAYTEINT